MEIGISHISFGHICLIYSWKQCGNVPPSVQLHAFNLQICHVEIFSKKKKKLVDVKIFIRALLTKAKSYGLNTLNLKI